MAGMVVLIWSSGQPLTPNHVLNHQSSADSALAQQRSLAQRLSLAQQRSHSNSALSQSFAYLARAKE